MSAKSAYSIGSREGSTGSGECSEDGDVVNPSPNQKSAATPSVDTMLLELDALATAYHQKAMQVEAAIGAQESRGLPDLCLRGIGKHVHMPVAFLQARGLLQSNHHVHCGNGRAQSRHHENQLFDPVPEEIRKSSHIRPPPDPTNQPPAQRLRLDHSMAPPFPPSFYGNSPRRSPANYPPEWSANGSGRGQWADQWGVPSPHGDKSEGPGRQVHRHVGEWVPESDLPSSENSTASSASIPVSLAGKNLTLKGAMQLRPRRMGSQSPLSIPDSQSFASTRPSFGNTIPVPLRIPFGPAPGDAHVEADPTCLNGAISLALVSKGPSQKATGKSNDENNHTAYVVDSNNNRVCQVQLDPLSLSRPVITKSTSVLQPTAVCAEYDGTVFVAAADNTIRMLWGGSAMIRQFGCTGTVEGPFNGVTSLALTPNDGLLVADSGNHRLVRMKRGGAVQSVIPLPYAPHGLAVGDGKAFVTCSNDSVLLVVNMETSKVIGSWGGPGSEPGQFLQPKGVYVDMEKRIVLVADCGNRRVQIFGLAGDFISEMGTRPANEKQPTRLGQPMDVVCVGTGRMARVYVADASSNRLPCMFLPSLP